MSADDVLFCRHRQINIPSLWWPLHKSWKEKTGECTLSHSFLTKWCCMYLLQSLLSHCSLKLWGLIQQNGIHLPLVLFYLIRKSKWGVCKVKRNPYPFQVLQVVASVMTSVCAVSKHLGVKIEGVKSVANVGLYYPAVSLDMNESTSSSTSSHGVLKLMLIFSRLDLDKVAL